MAFIGNIHTARITTRSGKEATVFQSDLAKRCIGKKSSKGTFGVFNPNEAWQELTGSKEPCMTMADFYTALRELYGEEALDSSSILTRIDFKIDNMWTMPESRWVKLCDLLILAYSQKHAVTPDKRYRTFADYGGLPKAMQADNGVLEVAEYNKQIQKAGTDETDRRLEFRYRGKKAGLTVEGVLTEIASELPSLADYYKQAVNARTKQLWKNYQSCGDMSCFLRANEQFIFRRSQLRDLYRLVGSVNPEKATDSFCMRNKLHFIQRREFVQFISELCKSIDDYLNGQPRGISNSVIIPTVRRENVIMAKALEPF